MITVSRVSYTNNKQLLLWTITFHFLTNLLPNHLRADHFFAYKLSNYLIFSSAN